MLVIPGQLPLEIPFLPAASICRLQLLQCRHQRLRDELSSVLTESSLPHHLTLHALNTNRSISCADFHPSRSTPVDTSTTSGATVRMASTTLLGLRPPARTHPCGAALSRTLRLSLQSCTFPVPP